jgi:polyribonucleotide nucleotidyltransferase
MYKLIQKNIDLGDGRIITIETGKLAKQADGAVVVRFGDTMLLATVVAAKDAKADVDFMPLSVEYKEKYASAGRFPGGFIKREARPSEREILTARLIDRVLRPLFPSDYHAEVFVTVELISAEKEIMPDALAGLAASAALAVSNIPFHGPISEVRVARVDGKLMINPTVSELAKADIDIMVGASYDNIMMVEGEMSEISEKEMIDAISFAHDAIKVHCKAQVELTEMVGKTEKIAYCHEVHNLELKAKVHADTYEATYKLALSPNANKHDRFDNFHKIKEEFIASLGEGVSSEDLKLVSIYYHDVEKEAVRNAILNEGVRLDGRKTNQIRPIWSEVGYLPSAHGSAIFTRGETQSLTSVTLGTKLNQQSLDGVLVQGSEKFILHYNFPPFSTGDAKAHRGTGRREIGHGNLAHRALKGMIPSDAEGNPYTIRVVSDILESNGSSSMATVCAGTLALMDAGVKMKKPVTGLAMGLITGNGKFAVLSDILGDEDHLGDMDFKVTGTVDGITACQMDIKVDGLSYEILTQALDQAKEGRLHIMGEIMKTISKPNDDYKPHAPRIERIIIPKEMIGAVIGPGGKIIQEIQASTGATIALEEVGNTGVVDISATNKESITNALNKIKGIVSIPEVGDEYDAKVKTIMPYGAFVEFLPGKDGLLHISEIEWRRLNTVEEVLKEGDIVKVKLLEIDKSGKYKLSRKVLLPRPPKEENANKPAEN